MTVTRSALVFSIAVALFAILVFWIDPYDLWSDGTHWWEAGAGKALAGRDNWIQRMMLLVRCVVFPLMLFSHLVQARTSPNTSVVGWLISITSTTLWPRRTDLWGWAPNLLMIACRSVLGVCDAAARGNFSRDWWSAMWRFWQHATCFVSLLLGNCFFHSEPRPGDWRAVRDRHGQASPRVLPNAWVAAAFLLCTAGEALVDPSSLPRGALVVGFWRQVWRSFITSSDPLTWVLWVVVGAWCLTCWLRLPSEDLLTRLVEGILAYLVLSASHRVSEAMLCLVVVKECSRLRELALRWGDEHILGKSTAVLDPDEDAIAKVQLGKDLLVQAVPPNSVAAKAGIAVQMRITTVAGERPLTPEAVWAAARRQNSKFQVELSEGPFPLGADAADLAFFTLRQEVRNTDRRLTLIIHFLVLDRAMYFLSDFAQKKEVVSLLVRHVSYTLVVLAALISVAGVNHACSRGLAALIAAVELRSGLSLEVRARLAAFRDRLMVHPQKMGIYVFGFRLDKRFLARISLAALGYAGTAKHALQFVGLHSSPTTR